MSAQSFRDVGWVWEGQGMDPGVPPSVYGVGEGATYFGLARCVFIFHPTNRVTLGKLRDKAEVVADISKWKLIEIPPPEGEFYGVGYRNKRDSNPATAVAEAENLSRLSVEFPNVTGAFIDDTTCMFGYDNYAEDVPQRVRDALHSANPGLKLWIVVYVSQLDAEYWKPFLPFVDVVALFMGADDIPDLERNVDRCAAVFPGKAINVGSYIHDYRATQPVPLERIAQQYETMYKLWQGGRIAGYNILGAMCIDRDPEEAEWIRGFLAER